ncbi:hypothetical protein TRVA0_013S00276 [Trichomonascus vanleenenianus]|uniref:uncharacterized protein n=1 Tax=Trichomonascus vanleenenianus TaxID=2268995 RepID=UPI003EC9A35B
MMYRDYYQLPIHVLMEQQPLNASQDVKYFNLKSELDEALKVDVLMDFSGHRGINYEKVLNIAADHGVKLYFPYEYGSDYQLIEENDVRRFFLKQQNETNYARSKGMKVVEMKTGILANKILDTPQLISIDPEKRGYTKHKEQESRQLAISFAEDIGLALASLGHQNPDTLPDCIHIQSDQLSLRQLVDIYERSKFVKLEPHGLGKDYGIIHSLVFTPGKHLTFDKNDSRLVNPNRFEWTRFEPTAIEYWSQAPDIESH